MAVKFYTFLLAGLCGLLLGCTPVQHISKTEVRYESVESTASLAGDDSITALIAPYKSQIDAEMNEVIGTVAKELTKRKPESTLGNFYADAMMAGAVQLDPEVDFAIANYGGLRVPYLSPGPLTKGQIFELSPFDNLLVIVQIPADILDTLMHRLAASGGWPVSKGLNMTINDAGLVDYTIDGLAPQSTAIYRVAMPDYVANGGDGLDELIPLERIQSGILVRDVIMEYVIALTQSGQKIDGNIEGRIVQEKE